MAENGNGTAISYRWVANALVGMVFAIVVAGLGWIKASIDAMNVRLDAMATDVATMKSNKGTVDYRMDAMDARITVLAAKSDNLDTDLSDIQHQIDINSDWIQAHAMADLAHRRLHPGTKHSD